MGAQSNIDDFEDDHEELAKEFKALTVYDP